MRCSAFYSDNLHAGIAHPEVYFLTSEIVIFGFLKDGEISFMRLFHCCTVGILVVLVHAHPAFCQLVKPGVPGMAPSKWITIKNSQAPGRNYRFDGTDVKTYTQEDIFFKMWLPVIHKSRFGILIGPQYRTEQLEFEDKGENPIHQLSNWNLRSMGVDIKSYAVLDSSSLLLTGFQINQSSSINHNPYKNVPLNFTLSTAYLHKLSPTREIGAGVLMSRGFNRFSVLPVFIYNNTYSPKRGIEISLPYKIAWRHNLTPNDIVYLKAEGSTRSYYCNGIEDHTGAFRRTDLDVGIWYNRRISKLFGVEVYGGYKRNLTNNMPSHVTTVNASGMAFSVEFSMKAPTLR